jgi:hypothetical protein
MDISQETQLEIARIVTVLRENGNIGYQIPTPIPHLISAIVLNGQSILAVIPYNAFPNPATDPRRLIYIRDMEYSKKQRLNITAATNQLSLYYRQLEENHDVGIDISSRKCNNSVLFIKSNPSSHFAVINTANMPRRLFIRLTPSDLK